MTTYTYKNIYKKKDGTLIEYTREIEYEPKPCLVLSNDIIDEIKAKYGMGVTKRRLCNEYKLYTRKLERILLC